MCQKVTCGRCGKATWSGCGQHIEDALRGVPTAQRCTCASASSSSSATGGQSNSSSLFSRLFGR